jgi:predicted RNA-binding protein with PUA-like domain
MADKRIFLIQSSGKPSEHMTVAFSDRTYADEVIKHGYYRHETWDSKARDQDFGKIEVGDYVLHYCTNDVESYPGQIKNIFEVVAIEKIDDDIVKALKRGRINKTDAEQLAKSPHVLKLRLNVTLNKGLELANIRKWVEEGILSSSMNNCGRIGFNVCQVDPKDYEAIMEWNKSQPPEAPTALGALLEEDLRSYIASQPTIEPMFGEAYKGYNLYKESDGRTTGELYDTKTVGQIDLLYQNDTGELLVIELKRTEDTTDKAVGQIARYLGWVQENIGKTKNVKGLLVARSASEELKYATKALKNCKLCTYEIQFRFSHVS